MPRRNRVDPYGDLQAVTARQGITGNRGCLVDEQGSLARHHNGSLWILCRLRYRDWRHPLDAPGTWTPLFFLDDAVGLAAGHRPCGLCRRDDYLAYRTGVERGLGARRSVLAPELNRRLAAERLVRGRGLERRADRVMTTASMEALPIGAVIVHRDHPHLVTARHLQPFDFGGWGRPVARPTRGEATVLTPPTSILALRNGFVPTLHPSAAAAGTGPVVAAGAPGRARSG